MLNIKGLDKAEILMFLYNLAIENYSIDNNIYYKKPEKMTEEKAKELILESDDLFFDHLHGVRLQLNLSGNEVDLALYND